MQQYDVIRLWLNGTFQLDGMYAEHVSDMYNSKKRAYVIHVIIER